MNLLSFVTAVVVATSVITLGGTSCAVPPTSADASEGGSDTVVVLDGSESDWKAAAVVENWKSAWNHGDAARLSSLFAADGVYTDNAFGAAFTGPDGVTQWIGITLGGIANVAVNVRTSFGRGDHIAVVSTFSGQIRGAPTPFNVPMNTIITVSGEKVTSVTDTYNLAALLKQSGLPADFDPTAK